MFLEHNPGYTELSDRKMLDWACKSGLPRPKATGSLDRPSMRFGLPHLDDNNVTRTIRDLASTMKRNYVVAELKSNLTAKDRKSSLTKFSAPQFEQKAIVM